MGAAEPASTLRGMVYLRRQGPRIWVHWRLAGGTREEAAARWMAMRLDWRFTFPRHADACYSHARRMWSVPLRNRERLYEWIDAWGLAVGEQGEEG